MTQFQPGFSDFSSAARGVSEFLCVTYDFKLCMVNRIDGDEWTVAEVFDPGGYGVKAGTTFSWGDSICSRMVLGKGPNVAPNVGQVEAYADAPICERFDIHSFLGVPIQDSDGHLFGTLCAISPEPKDESLADALPTFTILSRLLSTCLSADLRIKASQSTTGFSELPRYLDSRGRLTQLGWQRVVDFEEVRCKRFGNVASVMVVKLANPAQSDQAITVIQELFQDDESFFDDGEGTLRILLPDCSSQSLAASISQLAKQLENGQIEIRIGGASRDPEGDLVQAIDVAEETTSS